MKPRIPKGKPRPLWPNVYVEADEADDAQDAEEPARDSTFRGVFIFIAILHVLFVAGLFIWGHWHHKAPAEKLIWMDGGALGGGNGENGNTSPETAPSPAAPARDVEKPEPPAPIDSLPEPLPAPVFPPPLPAPPPSELSIAKATPAPLPATPRAITPKPLPKATPKPTPKATPKPTPRASPKPKASPKADAEAAPEKKVEKASASPSTSKAKSSPAVAKNGSTPAAQGSAPGAGASKGVGANAGTGKGTGTTGNGSGTGGTSEFGWYLGKIRDALYNEWQQPTSIVRSSADFVTRVKVRIGKDGTVLNREVTISSGNTLMDDSVVAAAEKVQKIAPLPSGLTTADYYEVSIDFKLDQGQ